MRIISGFLKGRSVGGYDVKGTRPTMDRVKESVFASIQSKIPKSIVLDLFSGSGSLGIEAISNGADCCYFVDDNPKIVNILKENIRNFNIEDKCYIINKDYYKAIRLLKDKNIKFNVIFIDPPYKDKIIEKVLMLLIENELISKKAVVVCEYRFDELASFYDELKLIKTKKYSDTFVSIYERSNYICKNLGKMLTSRK